MSISEVNNSSKRRLLLAVLGASLLAMLIVGNLLWIYRYRFGLPFSIDEAGYLQRAFQDQQAIGSGNIHAMLARLESPDIVAPMLPFVSGALGAIVHMSPWGFVGVQQLFYLLAVLSAYLLARKLSTTVWAALAAVTVASLPGLIVSSRQYLLAEPAAALFMVVLLLQLRVAYFQSVRRAIIWGISIGLFSLTRTMVLGLIPAFLLVAGVRAIVSETRRRSVGNYFLGICAAVIVASTWYATSWHTVFNYLTQYGYGSQANLYTGSHRLSLASRVIQRLNNFASQDLYLPILLALIFVVLIRFSVNRFSFQKFPLLGGKRSIRDGISRTISTLFKMGARSDYMNVVGVVVIGIFILTTTSNSGTYFELPLVPPLVVVLITPLRQCSRMRQLAGAVVILVASGLTLIDQYGFAPGLARYSSVEWSKLSIVAFNDNDVDFVGPRLRSLGLGGVWWSNCGGATITCFYGKTSGITVSYMEMWPKLNNDLTKFLYSYSAKFGYEPVVFFAYQGPMLNTNSVGLTAQLSDKTLLIGALVPPVLRQGDSLHDQLELPSLGQPNFVLASGTASTHSKAAESNSSARIEVVRALRNDGFVIVKSFPLPDATPLYVWWKAR